MLRWLWRLNEAPLWLRWPIKLALVALTVLFVCFPNPLRLKQHVRRWRDPDALIRPDAPGLKPMIAALEPEVAGMDDPVDILRHIEQFVYRTVPYEWDWNTWGAADYIPTVAEVIEKGREDCDGRAVIAASLLRHFGYDARLVTDFAHVWVYTKRGEAMGPGKRRAVVSTDKGVKVDARGLIELPQALGFGIAVFPFGRELAVLFVVWVMLVTRRRRFIEQAAMLAAMALALWLLRVAGASYRHPEGWLQLAATGLLLAAVGFQLAAARRANCSRTAAEQAVLER